MTWLMSGNVLLGACECATYKNSTASFAKEGRMKELLLGGMDLCAHLCVSTPRDRTPVGWEWEDKYDWQLHHKCHWRDVSLRRCLFSKTCFLLQYILILRIAWREKKMFILFILKYSRFVKVCSARHVVDPKRKAAARCDKLTVTGHSSSRDVWRSFLF